MKKNLCIPVYLNEKIVFDLLATLEDGFSKVRAITDNVAHDSKNVDSVKAGFSTSNIISTFFGISLNADMTSEATESDGKTVSEERVHTSGSLFAKLRDTLIAEGKLISLANPSVEMSVIQVGDFIEIDGYIKKSPMVETLQTFIEVFETFTKFSNEPQLGNKIKHKQNRGENQIILDQMKLLLTDLVKGNTLDLIVEKTDRDISALLPVKMKYFESDLETELLDGSYKVMGKVIRVVDSGDSVNLFRKTSFKIFQEKMLNEFTDIFNSSLSGEGQGENFVMPKIVSKIDGPVFVIIPIAIYA